MRHLLHFFNTGTMKKRLFFLLLGFVLNFSWLSAQSNLQGINYQGVARDTLGKILANTTLTFKVSLLSLFAEKEQVYYTETHQVNTDNLGLFRFVIGMGKITKGQLSKIPWAQQNIFLQAEMASKGQKEFALLHRSEILAVPYAFYTATADQLMPDPSLEIPAEKNQSLYWTTSGNSATKPPTHFIGTLDNKPLVFKTNNIVSMTLSTDGRLQLSNRTAAGPDNLKSSYPMVVEGAYNTQGIWIEINGSRSKSNNFLTFADAQGIQGRVEGQTVSELESSDTYVYQSAIFTLNGIALAANIGALVGETIDAWAKIWTWPKGVPLAAKGVTYTIQAASLLVASIKWSERLHKTVGVAYSSGNGDYAEWLKRMPGERDLQFGEIVGVTGGLISLNTQNSKHLMVVSKAPIVLGNTPGTDAHQYEKVAFMGQVLVKVAGPVNVGDYILPSGNNDGCGVALAPSEMKAGDYDKIVGVAWQAGTAGVINYVNVAVGINNNDLADKIDKLGQRIDHIMAHLEGKSEFNPITAASPSSKPSTSFGKLMSDDEFDRYIDQHEFTIRQLFSAAKAKMLEEKYDELSMKYFNQVFDDPVKALKTLRKDPNYLTHWHSVDKQLLGK